MTIKIMILQKEVINVFFKNYVLYKYYFGQVNLARIFQVTIYKSRQFVKSYLHDCRFILQKIVQRGFLKEMS